MNEMPIWIDRVFFPGSAGTPGATVEIGGEAGSVVNELRSPGDFHYPEPENLMRRFSGHACRARSCGNLLPLSALLLLLLLRGLAPVAAQGGGPFPPGSAGNAWFEAAERGNATAQCMVGYLFSIGSETATNLRAAREWYSRAAAQGHREGRLRAAICIMEAIGGPEDSPEAARLLEPIASAGNVLAQTQLGRNLLRAHGMVTNYPMARKWLARAADQGDAPAMVDLAMHMMARNPDFPLDFDGGRALLERAAAQGSGEACYQLGLQFERGWGVPKDLPKAMAWYRKGADLGSGMAWGALGSWFEDGLEGPPDLSRAVEAYERAVPALEAEGPARRVLCDEAIRRSRLLRKQLGLPPRTWPGTWKFLPPYLAAPPSGESPSR